MEGTKGAKPTLQAWKAAESPSEEAIRKIFADEGLSPSGWSNDPGDRYTEHSHSYRKVLYCITGSITFSVDSGEITVRPGDRLDIPPHTPHAATVGPDGVVCMEAAV